MCEPCVDLGRPQYDPTAECRPLAPADRFGFACAGCGDCCRSRKDLLLSGYDLWRICGRLQLPPAVIIRGYCSRAVGAQTLLPVLRLGQHSDCPFLHKSRCTIHEAAPLACMLYPLMQQIDTDTGAVVYYAQPADCGLAAEQVAAADYLQASGIRERESIDVAWAQGCTRLAARVRAFAPLLPPAQQKMVQYKIYDGLYASLDWQRPYLPQLEQTLRSLDAYLNKVTARAGQGSGAEKAAQEEEL